MASQNPATGLVGLHDEVCVGGRLGVISEVVDNGPYAVREYKVRYDDDDSNDDDSNTGPSVLMRRTTISVGCAPPVVQYP